MVHEHKWRPFCRCAGAGSCRECRYWTGACLNPSLEVCICDFCDRRRKELYVGICLYEKTNWVLSGWNADWKMAGGSETEATRAIQKTVRAYWVAMRTKDAQNIHTEVTSYVRWREGRCLTGAAACSGRPATASCYGCLRHVIAVLHKAMSIRATGKTREESWAEAWMSADPTTAWSTRPEGGGIDLSVEERERKVGASLMESVAITHGLRAWC